MHQNILITGASGFLGQHLCDFLRHQSCKVTPLSSKQADLTQQDALKYYESECYDIIYHLAAWTQAGDFCLQHPGEQWIINQKINTNLLEYWVYKQPQAKLVFMGTSCVYAPDSQLTEDEYMYGEPIESLYTYAMTKRMLYQGARALNQQYGCHYLCAVPSTLYGAGYHTDGRQMHFIFDLIRKIIRGKEHNEPVILWGDGYQKRELVHVDDFVKYLWHLTHDVHDDIVNIGAGHEYTIREFAHHICDIIGYNADTIYYDTSRYVGAKSKILNTKKIQTYIDNYQMLPLEEGLQQTIKWFYETKAYQ